MRFQSDLDAKMRSILIDWLIDVHMRFKLKSETLFLTVYIIDKFLSTQAISRKELQLVGVTAMWMASKYEEIYANEVKDYAYMTDFTYSIQQIIDLESQILVKIDFDLMTSSALNFLQIYWKFTSVG